MRDQFIILRLLAESAGLYFHPQNNLPEELQIELFPEYKVQKQRQQGEWNYILSVIFRPLDYNNMKLNNAWLIQQSQVK